MKKKLELSLVKALLLEFWILSGPVLEDCQSANKVTHSCGVGVLRWRYWYGFE